MKVGEFIKRLANAVNKVIGFPVFSAADIQEMRSGLDGKTVEWKHARRSMEKTFEHLRDVHNLPCRVRLPSERELKGEAVRFRTCAQKLCRAVSCRSPRTPSTKGWQEMPNLQINLQCSIGKFLTWMVHFSTREMEESGGRSEPTEAGNALVEMIGGLVPATVMEQAFRIGARAYAAVAWLIDNPRAFYAIADAARELPAETQMSFLARALAAVSVVDDDVDERGIAMIIERAKEPIVTTAN